MKMNRIKQNGTLIGAISEGNATSNNTTISVKPPVIPEIVISACYSTNSLNQIVCDTPMHSNKNNMNNVPIESTEVQDESEHDSLPHDAEFEQIALNRTTSDSDILDSSIYSEVYFPPLNVNGFGGSAIMGSVIGMLSVGNGNGVSSGSTAHISNSQTTTTGAAATAASATVIEIFNTSSCSRADSRQSKRSRRKSQSQSQKMKSKCGGANTVGAQHETPVVSLSGSYTPQYTAIFVDPLHQNNAASAMGQLTNAAASLPFLNATNISTETTCIQQQHHLQHYQYCQSHSMLPDFGYLHPNRRNLMDPNIRLPINMRSNSTQMSINSNSSTSTTLSSYSVDFNKWFTRPSLPFVIGILALGGVACTLGGIVLGSTGLIEHSTHYLSASLLMIGIGVSLLVISGAIWRLSLPDDFDECPCFRYMETCRNCNSPFCGNRLITGNYLYAEFQHRPPPPSYLTSLNECSAMGLLIHPSPNTLPNGFSTFRISTPPPLYRSTVSLNTFMSVPTQSATNFTANNICSEFHTAPSLPSLPATMPNSIMLKEINYLELD